MFSKHDQLQGYDDELLAAMDAEDRRQEDHIELIASENYASKRVMQAQGSGLTNKYAEGYPGKRYYSAGSAGAAACFSSPPPHPCRDAPSSTAERKISGRFMVFSQDEEHAV